MSRFLKLMSVLAIVALIAVPAFAEVQNVKVSGDIDSKMISRENYDFTHATSTGDKDTWFMTTARVQIDADLTDNVSTCVRLLNQRDWNISTAGAEEIVIDLASVKLKEMFYQPLTLTIGKQNLRFGNGLVVGDPDTNDTSAGKTVALTATDLDVRKSFDAVRATLDYSPLVLDIIMSKINANTISAGDNNDDHDLYGINAAYKFNQYNSEAEAYMFAKVNRNADTLATAVKTDTVLVYGVRGSLEPISKLVLDGEVAIQDGDYVDTTLLAKNIDRRAWAADLGGTYAIDYKWSPKFAARYSYRSGQKSPVTTADVDTDGNTTEYKAWDTTFEDQTHGIVANQIFNGNNDGVDSNGHTFNVMASVVPLQDLTLAVDYYRFKLVEEWQSATRSLNGTNYLIRKDDDLGSEVDVSLAYDYTEDVKLGLTAGYFLPGKTFLKDNNAPASTVMADVKVSF